MCFDPVSKLQPAYPRGHYTLVVVGGMLSKVNNVNKNEQRSDQWGGIGVPRRDRWCEPTRQIYIVQVFFLGGGW